MRAAPASGAFLHAAKDRLATLLEVAEGEALDIGWEAEAGLDRIDVERGAGGVDPDVAHNAIAVVLSEVHVDVGDLAEDVDVRCERGRRRVQEHEVLHEQHELFRGCLLYTSPSPRDGLL